MTDDAFRDAIGWPRSEKADGEDPNTSDAAFVVLVDMMRAAQKIYFRDRTSVALDVSRKLERKVDAAIKARSDKQRSLF